MVNPQGRLHSLQCLKSFCIRTTSLWKSCMSKSSIRAHMGLCISTLALDKFSPAMLSNNASFTRSHPCCFSDALYCNIGRLEHGIRKFQKGVLLAFGGAFCGFMLWCLLWSFPFCQQELWEVIFFSFKTAINLSYTVPLKGSIQTPLTFRLGESPHCFGLILNKKQTFTNVTKQNSNH